MCMKQARRATTVGEEVLGAGGPAVGAGSGSSDSCGLSGPAVELSAVELADLFVAETAALQGAGPAGDPASAECAHLWAEVEAALAGQDQDPAQVLHHSLSGAEANLGQVTDLGPAELVGVFDPCCDCWAPTCRAPPSRRWSLRQERATSLPSG